MRYNCRLTRARELAEAEASKPTPIRNAWAKRLELIK
jgi:hypothetical protein